MTPDCTNALRGLIGKRLGVYRRLPREDQDRAARALDIGCQFLLNVNDMERGCMTNDDWTVLGLSTCRDSYLPHVAKFLIRTDWPWRHEPVEANTTTTQ